MSELSHALAIDANREMATRFHAPRWIISVMRVAHSLWRHEARSKLLAITMASPRTVTNWMRRKPVDMSAEHLVALLRAEPAHFVPAVLGYEAYRALAREIVRQSKLEELKSQQAEQRRLIERLEKQASE